MQTWLVGWYVELGGIAWGMRGRLRVEKRASYGMRKEENEVRRKRWGDNFEIVMRPRAAPMTR